MRFYLLHNKNRYDKLLRGMRDLVNIWGLKWVSDSLIWIQGMLYFHQNMDQVPVNPHSKNNIFVWPLSLKEHFDSQPNAQYYFLIS